MTIERYNKDKMCRVQASLSKSGCDLYNWPEGWIRDDMSAQCYYRILSTYVNPVIRSVIISLLFSSFVYCGDSTAIQKQL